MSAVSVMNLSKNYGKAVGVRDVSFTVNEGDFFGFIGPNGAGKSTTLRVIMGLISPTSGQVRVFGKDVLSDKNKIFKDIGYMPSEASFYSKMKVGEVLKLSANLRGKDCKRESDSLCERLCLDAGKRISELSLGNRKKVSIVCAMQHNPRLYILDEPTSGLDPLIQREFFSLLKEKNKQGATVLLSSHVLTEIQKHCKNAAIIRNGKILVSDSIDNLGRTEAKRVTLRGTNLLKGSLLENLNIKDESLDDENASFLYRGSQNELISALSHLDIHDISISEPNLEEVFMHYYSNDGTVDING